MDTYSINLLRTQSVLSQEEVALLGRLRIISIVLILGLLVLGLFVGASYLAARYQVNKLEEERVTLAQSVNAQAKKQILLLSLQNRLPVIEKTLESQYPWDQVVNHIVTIVAPPYLKTFVIGDSNEITVTAQAPGLEDIQTMIRVALQQVEEKTIRSPQIVSLQITGDGSVEVVFKFIPILPYVSLSPIADPISPFLFPTAILGVGILIFFVLLIPAIQQTIGAFEEAGTLREKVESLRQKVAVLNRLDETSLQHDFSLTTQAIPVDKSLPTILSTIEGISGKTGVTVQSLVVEAPGSLATESAKQQTNEERRLGAYTVPFSVTLSGTFDQIKDFLSVSNSVLRLVRAKSFSLGFGEEQITTQVTFDTFYAPLTVSQDVESLAELQGKDREILSSLEAYPDVSVLVPPPTQSPILTGGKTNPFFIQ